MLNKYHVIKYHGIYKYIYCIFAENIEINIDENL